MNLTCKINGIEYPIVQGNTFSEEYNETLDSGNIIIAHIKKIKKLKPFDDVFVYDSNFNFGGYSYGTDDLKSGDVVDTNGNKKPDNIFFKHLLVDNYTEEFVNLKDKTYKYKISLMSETKRLEKVQCPNISVTQPLDPDEKVSIYKYLQRFVSMYSPKFKKVMNDRTKTWVYVSKYKVDSSLEKIFGNVYPPDFSLNAPTLRDILSKLMVCKDMIPYVENGVIKAMDITQRKNEFSLDDIPTTNIVGSMSSNDYCDALRRNYSEGLSQDSTCTSVEYLGFRNSDTALMTLGNMRLETRFPIYKINKMYMCYYKKADYRIDNKEYFFLCKQDITPLIKLNAERNVLSKDWDDFHKNNVPLNIEELSQYKLATLGYDIGSNHITGFGEMYSYPKGWWLTETKSYIENILSILDNTNPFGISSLEEKTSSLSKEEKANLYFEYNGKIFEKIKTPFAMKYEENEPLNLNIASALDMKGLFFQIDYQGFFNGSIIHSKDNGLDDIVSNDNSSSSLALLEYDGLSQKEKVNRLGNKTYQFTVRYDNYGNDLSFLQNVGDYFKHDDEEDIIIYHREIAIYDTYIMATYFAAKDYVLKNYYTSVFARHRTWNLMSYGESVHRAENRKTFLNLSLSNSFFEKTKFSSVLKLLSCFTISKEMTSPTTWENLDKINYGYISHYGREFDFSKKEYTNNYVTNRYLTDINSFVSGYSLCFNIKMFDNISMGSYLSDISPFEDSDFKEKDRDWLDTKDDYTGSNVSLHMMLDSQETGFVEKLGFYFGHKHSTMEYQNFTNYERVEEKINDIYKKINIYPLMLQDDDFLEKSGEEIFVYKDNKESIDMTYQIEMQTNDKNILFSSWMMKTNDLIGNFYKCEATYEKKFLIPGSAYDDFTFYNSTEMTQDTLEHFYPLIVVSFPRNLINIISSTIFNSGPMNVAIENTFIEYQDTRNISPDDFGVNYYGESIVYYLKLTPSKIVSIIENESVTIEFEQLVKWKYKKNGEIINKENVSIQRINFNFMESDFDNTPLDEDYAFFSREISDIHYIENNEDKIFNMSDSYYRLENGVNFGGHLFENIENQIDETAFLIEKGKVNSTKTVKKIFYKNMYVVTSTEPLRNTLVYDEYKQANFPDSLNVREDISVSDVFKVGEDEHGSFIEIDITQFRYDDIKSIQYWYKDIVNNDPDNSLMKFVFGVNLTDEDLRHHTVKVYASLVSNRDTRVYDQNHNVVGEVVNYLDENNEKPYGQNQYYMVK